MREQVGISVLTCGLQFYSTKTIRAQRKGGFSGLNKSLGSRVVWVKHHLRTESFIGFIVRSLEKAFYNFRESALSIMTNRWPIRSRRVPPLVLAWLPLPGKFPSGWLMMNSQRNMDGRPENHQGKFPGNRGGPSTFPW